MLNVIAHKPWITAEVVTICCSMSYTHTWTKLNTEVMSSISGAYDHDRVLIMHGALPEVNSGRKATWERIEGEVLLW